MGPKMTMSTRRRTALLSYKVGKLVAPTGPDISSSTNKTGTFTLKTELRESNRSPTREPTKTLTNIYKKPYPLSDAAKLLPARLEASKQRKGPAQRENASQSR